MQPCMHLIIQEQWQEWQNSKKLKDIPNVKVLNEKQEKKGNKKPELFVEEKMIKKEKTKKTGIKVKTTINKNIEDLFS